MLLSLLPKGFGTSGAERVATTALVLIFGGVFQFISTVLGHPAYWVAPWLAIFTYGMGFQEGLMNYYLSYGIVFRAICHLMAAAFGVADAMGYASAPSVLSRASSARRLEFVRGDPLLACSADAGSFSASSFLG